MSKPTVRLVIFFDGTDDTRKDRTNPWRTHELLADVDDSGIQQSRCYIAGVGTDFGQIVSGSIFGAGITHKICEGYEWLARNYKDGADVFVFGFSRGAFAARSFIQLIACCGLTNLEYLKEWTPQQAFARYDSITRQNEELVHPIYRLRHWQENPDAAPPGWKPSPDEQRMLDSNKIRVIKIKMAGLWDTVGSLGTDAFKNQGPSTQKAAAHNVRPTKTQEYGYHAIAIDEHRPMFEITLWRTFVEEGKEQETMDRYKQYYEQRWFIGAHCDVGGGYGDDDLPDLSLAWILDKASALGLALTHKIEPRPTAWYAKIHDSFEAFAGGALSIWDEVIPGDQRHYREIGRLPKQVDVSTGARGSLWSINETIDESVIRRWTEDPTYRPTNLVDYFRRNPERLPQNTTLAQRTQRIYANKYWNETGVFVRPNTTYRVRVVKDVGEPLRDASFLARGIDGEDWDSNAHKAAALVHGKRMDSAKWFALIATVDKKHPWTVTSDSEFSVPVSGQLLCYFNDVQLELFYKNNSGWVVLEVWPD